MRKKWAKKLFAGIVAMSLVLQGTVSDGSLIMAKAENGTKQSKVYTVLPKIFLPCDQK